MYEKSTTSYTAPAHPVGADKVDCTVQLLTVKDGDSYRSMVQFFLFPVGPASAHALLGESDGKVLVGWSVPLGDTSFPTREAVREAYETTAKGVPGTVWLEPTTTFLARQPVPESLPAGVSLDRDFAKQWGLSTYVPSKDNPNVLYEAPVA